MTNKSGAIIMFGGLIAIFSKLWSRKKVGGTSGGGYGTGDATEIQPIIVTPEESDMPRGIRNNNPGNIRLTADNWRGLSAQQTDGQFAQFDNPVFGIRAIARTLNTYASKGVDTIRGIITRWSATDQSSYVSNVAAAVGVDPDQPIDVRDKSIAYDLISAIIRQENGEQPYGADTILAGIRAA